ncbi:MAG TPA: hypothetical protein VH415_01370 [Nitrososphaeraceae archaeon]
MNDEPSSLLSVKPLKKAWCVGSNTVVVIDKSLVKALGITEDNTIFQQEIVDGGIFLRIVRPP